MRRLVGNERVVAAANEHFHGTFDITAMAALEGPFTTELLGQALTVVRARNAILQAEVAREQRARAEWTLVESQSPFRLREIERETSDTWRAVWRHECDTPVRAAGFRATWVRSSRSETSELVVGFHHALADGVTIRAFFEQIVQACATLASTHEAESALSPRAGAQMTRSLEVRPVLPPVVELTPARLRPSLLAKLVRQRLSRLPRRPLPDTSERIPPLHRRWRSQFRVLPSEDTGRLLKRCRAERASVGSAFAAAMQLECADDIRKRSDNDDSKTIPLELTLIVDMRKYARVPVARDHMGDIISAMTLQENIPAGEGVWALARRFRDRLETELADGMHYAWAAVPAYLGPTAQRLFASTKDGRAWQPALLLSNLGHHDFIASGPFRLVRMFTTAAQTQWGVSWAVSVNTVGETMSIHLGYVEPVFKEASAARFIDGVLRRLVEE